MFGNNPIRKQNLGNGLTLKVVEVFPTIQGEGPLAGEPAIFVRLAGCNLACYFCDTDFESNAAEVPTEELIDVILDMQGRIKTDLVVITGGEPLLQNIVPFIERLVPTYRVQIETAGTVWIDGLEEIMHAQYGYDITIVCSPKTGKVHPMVQNYCDDWKYIISAGNSTEDGLPTMSTQQVGKSNKLFRPDKQDRIWVQPCDEHNEEQNDYNMERTIQVAMKHGYRVSLQQHKIMGVD